MADQLADELLDLRHIAAALEVRLADVEQKLAKLVRGEVQDIIDHRDADGTLTLRPYGEEDTK